MKRKAIDHLEDYDGAIVWVEFGAGQEVSCGYEEGPSTEIDRLAQSYHSGCYRVEGRQLVSCKDSAQRVFVFNAMIRGIYEWTEEE